MSMANDPDEVIPWDGEIGTHKGRSRRPAAPAPLEPVPEALKALAADCEPVDIVVNAAFLLDRVPPPPDYIVCGAFETGSRVLLVGSSKTRKSFASLQLALCVASGGEFVGMAVPRARRVILANLENAADWQHRRLLAMCQALALPASALGDRLVIMNGRGKGVDLPQIEAAAVKHRAEVIICDPLYKLDGGADESDMGERKDLVRRLEKMGETTGAALVYVHHDSKGKSGDRDIRDRGAGSSIINRDVDCTLALTPWGDRNDAEADSLTVLEVLARNSPQRPESTLVFDSGAFFADPSRVPCKATSMRPRTPAGSPAGVPVKPFSEDAALALVESRTMTKTEYREAIKAFGGTKGARDAFLSKSLESGALEERRQGQREKLIGSKRAFELMLPKSTLSTLPKPESVPESVS